MYLENRDALLPEDKRYRNKLLRKQLEYIADRELDEKSLKTEKYPDPLDVYVDHRSQCSHIETIEGLIAKEEEFFYAYVRYLETIRCQKNIGMKEILSMILKNFYDMTDLSEEEKLVYRNPKYFKTLLSSPWIRIVKNQSLEEVGAYQYKQTSKRHKMDQKFKDILDTEVREVMEQIYQEFKT